MKKQGDPGYQTQEYLERKRAYDRNSYYHHREERQAANKERKYRIYEFLQHIKMRSQ